jgi:large subunit ribosomal protein L18
MESSQINASIAKRKRALRVRKGLRGNSQKPRMCINKSNAHLQVQLIDDETGFTLGSIATFSKEFRNTSNGKKNKESAKVIGAGIAKIAKEKNIERVVLDRGPSKYCGIIAALADSARENGLLF